MRSLASQIFRHAVQTARCERDITQDLKGALKPPEVKQYPAITDPEEFAIYYVRLTIMMGYLRRGSLSK